MIAFSCSRCQHALTRHDNEAGSKIACPGCGQRLRVPAIALVAETAIDVAQAALTPTVEPARRPVSPRDYIHPEDLAALENLKQIPLFDSCLKAVLSLAPERMLRGLNLAQKIRLGPKQLPHLHKLLPIACAVLGIDEPEFFLEMDPQPNAYTMGDTQPFVVVTSGLVDILSETELQAVVAHECGHIACRHVLYHTMAMLLLESGSSLLGPLAVAAMPVRSALFYWYRLSEFSCDRAAAIVARGPRPVVETMIRLAGGPRSVTGQVDIKQYLQQAAEYEQLRESHWDKLLQGFAMRRMDHPLLAVRAREVVLWCRSPAFQQIMAVQDGRRPASCSVCQVVLDAEWKFCKHCGTAVAPTPSAQS